MSNNHYNLQEKLVAGYDIAFDQDGVCGKRIASRLHEIAQIGLTDDNGSNRPGFSQGERLAKQLVAQWMKEAGLSVTIDGAGNVFGRLEGKDKNAKIILSGSHVDSVPNGGHFDGPLGVITALEVVEAWRKTGYQPEKSYEVVVFTDEEGSRFNSGFHGSEAVTGKGNIDEKLQLTDQAGVTFSEVLASVDLSVKGYQQAVRNLDDYELFIEVHIEQGKRLEKENLACGVVTGIAGPCWVEFTFTGQAGHAGNTPMNDRKDALIVASEFIQRVPSIPVTISSSAVATVGKLAVKPNGVNVIPGEVSLYVDMRDITRENQEQVVEKVVEAAQQIAEKHGVQLSYEEKIRISPVPIEAEFQALLAKSLETNNISPYYLPSGAGHDAMIIGEKVPAAMLFVKSKNGVSHHPDEWSDLNDCVQAVHVLKTFLENSQ
ncbi:Zn-dependent hydrolase [Pseudogracilibacillus auburnensis]|uniref:Allantoate deiminase n=1 Tax=Pseudogracilibacillus auburnensis TaxID=1494959 RepID=A0A2V3W1H7_9BACI|nr:Zn-dependent hydrolase [Pseudogracilibacillus auburnensis]PXW86961.1 allantoate deiminase [Pseudogracilibacillus auburnensis]